jgi:hypothetical protein
MLQASMTRTFHPKYASYTGDGSGRDTYVILNNGGLTSSDKPNMMFRKTTAPNQVVRRPGKPAPSITYISDGSGRDSYVLQNSGGLVHDYKGVLGQQYFKNSLRQLEKSTLPLRKPIPGIPEITDFINYVTPRTRKRIVSIAKYQRLLDERLSPPRRRKSSQRLLLA